MLGHGQEYEAAKARYAPFDRIVDPDPAARAAIVGVVRQALDARRPAYVIVNNKAEGLRAGRRSPSWRARSSTPSLTRVAEPLRCTARPLLW
jgi:hypothetical protein